MAKDTTFLTREHDARRPSTAANAKKAYDDMQEMARNAGSKAFFKALRACCQETGSPTATLELCRGLMAKMEESKPPRRQKTSGDSTQGRRKKRRRRKHRGPAPKPGSGYRHP